MVTGGHGVGLQSPSGQGADMIFVQNFTQPDYEAKSFTPQKCVICDPFLVNQQRKCIKYQGPKGVKGRG